VAIEQGQNTQDCFGFDIDETLVPHWQHQVRIRGARVFRTIEYQYMQMAHYHDRAMGIKERLLEETRVAPGQYGETINAVANEKPAHRRAMDEATDRLSHLITELEAVIEQRQSDLKPFPA